MVAARPDLVILYGSADNRPAAERPRAMGVPGAAFKIDRIEAFRRATPLLGRLVGAEPQARALVDSVSATLDAVRRESATLPHPRVFMHTWDHTIIAIGELKGHLQLDHQPGRRGRGDHGDAERSPVLDPLHEHPAPSVGTHRGRIGASVEGPSLHAD